MAAKITITTVMVAGHGTQQHYANMRYTAETTGGRFYEVTNPKQLPKIFTKEASVVSRSLLVEGEFQPSIAPSTSGPLRGLNGVPPLAGYVLTVPREGLAQVQVANQTEEGVDPVYAYWNHGLGRSIAFTSDAATRWTAGWRSWGDFRAFWEQSVRWLMRPAVPANAQIRSRVEGETAIVDLEATDASGGFANNLDPDGLVVEPDGESRSINVVQTGPGRWRAEFPVAEAGAYLVSFGLGRPEDGRRASVQASISVPYPKEFRTVRDNRALLEQISAKTGGRVIEIGSNTQAIDYILREGLPVPESARRMWDLMAILAAVFFLLDVAVRRVAVDWKDAREGVAGALRVREAGEGTVEAWKKARSKSSGAAVRKVDLGAAPSGAVRDALSSGPSLDVRGESKDDGAAARAREAAARDVTDARDEG
ncbi:MAG: hypothetical protein ACO3QC_13710, partial [Phycisphaerales bacterium]